MNSIGLDTVSLLAVAITVAILVRRIHLPYTVGLVITGACLPLVHSSAIEITHDLIFDLILPPLLFEAAIALHWSELRRDALPVLALSTAGVAISAAVVTFGITTALGWPLGPSLVFGILIAATDPVSVIAMFKDIGVEGRLRLLVEGESLLNDGVAAVLFSVALTATQQSGVAAAGAFQIMQGLVFSAGGGIAVGLAVGGLAILVAGRTTDHLVETALTTVAAYGSFLLADRLGGSGVLATVAAGLLMGNLGILRDEDQGNLSSRGREFVVAFWDFAAFIANSFVFILIGVTVSHVPFKGLGIGALVVIIFLVLTGRALTVYPLCLMFARSRWAIPIEKQHVLWWGGLRGALALALALALPPTLPLRNEIVIATFGVVVFSVVVQGLTMKLLMSRLGLLPRRP